MPALFSRCTPLRTVSLTTLFALLLALAGCGGGQSGSNPATPPGSANPASAPTLSPAAQLGEKIFKDVSLSASGGQSCASCHDPAHFHAQSNAQAVQSGGSDLMVAGFRATPSLRYLNLTPAFAVTGDGAAGGFNRDGRAASLAEQGMRPFLAPHEMANASPAEVVAKLARTPYAAQFSQTFGSGILADADSAFARITFALQQYQLEAPEFHLYNSKYDQFLAGRVRLSDAELRGLALFNDKNKANCAACHTSSRAANGTPPLFTDFSFDAFGVPRNSRIPATRDIGYFDLGLCGPDRTDLTSRTELCGQFKVPTLRNVAMRKVFFHNGQFDNLRDVLRFYVTRDTQPELWYPRLADGSIDKFNDLPPAMRANVNTSEAPYNRRPGQAPALSDAEIDDVLQFLNTLTDGYTVP
jgi:cytochrome c peroxidase